jgi:hypothetical protein
MTDSPPPPAGWYADPENPAGERWWNGSAWSDHKRPSTTATPEVPVAPVVAPAAPVVAPVETGFTYGAIDAPAARPDPYAAAATYPAAAYPAAGYSAAPAPYGAAPSPSASNGLAVAGLITSLAGILFSFAAVVGIVLSILGLVEARKREAAGNPNTGKGLALAGLIVGIVICVVGALFVVLYFVFLVNVGYPY